MKIIGKIVDIHNREIFSGEIYIKEGRIEKIVRTENGPGIFILPGFIDSHVHIESSMVTPASFAETAITHGTIGTVSDPHEIANVMGKRGVEYMIENGNKVPFYFWFGAPSCVPATSFETSGYSLNHQEVYDLLMRKDIKYLSEMMNFPGVIFSDSEVMEKIRISHTLNKPIDGHAPGLSGDELKLYTKAGITTDHECSTIEEALEKVSLGMKILIREGSAARNLEALKELIKICPEKVMLCSDDIHPEMLLKGHINVLVSKLIRNGYDIFDVLRACTINPVDHYGLDSGLLREGDNADFILTDDIENFKINEVWIKGERVYSKGKCSFSAGRGEQINNFNSSRISGQSIKITRGGEKIRIIEALDGELITRKSERECWSDNIIDPLPDEDILKIVVKDRYHDNPPAVAFIKGFGLKRGAFASSVAHDSHNIICIGTDDSSIVSAINEIVRLKGGLSFCDGSETMSMQLPVGGIMSDDKVGNVAARYEELTAAVKRNGCVLKAPFMTLSFMALLVIPEIKLSDKGLFDGKKFSFTSLFTS